MEEPNASLIPASVLMYTGHPSPKPHPPSLRELTADTTEPPSPLALPEPVKAADPVEPVKAPEPEEPEDDTLPQVRVDRRDRDAWRLHAVSP
jgi:hypothetical protein